MAVQITIPVSESSQVGEVRRTATRLSEMAGLPETERGQAAIVATELATNLAKYSKDGRLHLQAGTGDERFIELLAVDSGPGLDDVSRSLQDGVSTGGSPGTGLGAIRRLSHEFDIYSTVGKGTVVWSRIAAQKKRGKGAFFQWAAVSTPAPKEPVCGDSWRIVEAGPEIAVLVADGLGHGPLAAAAADRAVQAFEQTPHGAPAAVCERIHKALSGTRGAALAIARASRSGGLIYAGVGNIAGAVISDGKSRGLASQNGTAGVHVRRVQEFAYDWPEHGLLVMHSDGLSNRWSLAPYPGLTARHPAIVAGVLHRDFLRGRDDATVVVVRKVKRHGAGTI